VHRGKKRATKLEQESNLNLKQYVRGSRHLNSVRGGSTDICGDKKKGAPVDRNVTLKWPSQVSLWFGGKDNNTEKEAGGRCKYAHRMSRGQLINRKGEKKKSNPRIETGRTSGGSITGQKQKWSRALGVSACGLDRIREERTTIIYWGDNRRSQKMLKNLTSIYSTGVDE